MYSIGYTRGWSDAARERKEFGLGFVHTSGVAKPCSRPLAGDLPSTAR